MNFPITDAPDKAFRLDDRVALITGSTRGIGAAIAHEFAAAGARVIVTGRDPNKAAEVADEIKHAGGDALSIDYDARSMTGVEALADRVKQQIGRLDILVNNAAILKPHTIEKLKAAEFDEIFQVNVKATLFLTQSLRPLLAESASGVVVNITAAGGHVPMVGIGAYSASKAAMINLTHTLAKEWAASGIRVNALTPGTVATDMVLPIDPERRERFVAEIASLNLMKRIGVPAEIARAARFLASDAASFITGTALVVDGGMLA